VISLDDLRAKYGKSRSDQDLNTYLRHVGKEELKEQFRKHGQVVWDATNLRKDFRSILCQLGFDYHALVTIVVSHIPESLIYASNHSRQHNVSNQVVDTQLKSLEWIEDVEAHRVAYVNRSEILAFKGGCDADALTEPF
jgi:predicted kinase